MYKTDKTNTGLTIWCTNEDYKKLNPLIVKRGYKQIRITDYTYYNNYWVEDRYDKLVEYIHTETVEAQELKHEHEKYLRSVLQY